MSKDESFTLRMVEVLRDAPDSGPPIWNLLGLRSIFPVESVILSSGMFSAIASGSSHENMKN